jgi:uncharacterized protein (DUF952 family)
VVGRDDHWSLQWLTPRYLGWVHSLLDGGSGARHRDKTFFSGVPDLLLVAVSASALGDAIKWEPSRGGDLFPHLYGPLPVELTLWVKPLLADGEGRHIFAL